MMQIIIVQLLQLLIIIIGLPAGIVAPSCLVRQRPAGNQHTRMLPTSSQAQTQNKINADLFSISIERVTYYYKSTIVSTAL